MAQFTNISTDDVELPALGLFVQAGETVDVTDEQAAAIGDSHPIIQAASAAKKTKTPAVVAADNNIEGA
jgi:hypothetical protein